MHCASPSNRKPHATLLARVTLAALCVGAVACSERFTLPPVPEGEIPLDGAYNFDRVWNGRGRIIDMVLAGGALYVITERNGSPEIEALRTGSVDGDLLNQDLWGVYNGLRHPVAIASRSISGDRFLFVADNRGAAPLERTHEILDDNGVIAFTTTAVPVPGHIASRTIPAVSDTLDIELQWWVDALEPDEKAWFLLGTERGRIGIWIEVAGDGYLRPVRSDGAFPVDSVAFVADSLHTVDIAYLESTGEYSITLNDTTFAEEVPVFHPLDAPLARLGIRHEGSFTSRLGDLTVVGNIPGSNSDSVYVDLDWESPDEADNDWDPGPFFANIPSPAVLVFNSRDEGGPTQTFTDPDWVAIHGVTVDGSNRVVVSVTERDPADRTGIETRPQVVHFERAGEPPVSLAGRGTGLGAVASPKDVYFDGTGILVVDSFLNRVQQLDMNEPNLGYNPIPPLTQTEPLFAAPSDVASDAAGFVYVADTDNHRVLRFTPEGAFADTVYSLSYGPTSGAGSVLFPSAIESDTDEVWIADTSNERVVVLKRAGTITGRSSE